ncbi:MAG TPA: 1,4-alpha-glucan branching protein GlgB [Phycisphaerae bacterium]|nr:1,4-alpha-glucan branching protein GlgB [Phycisphaerae bacterium]
MSQSHESANAISAFDLHLLAEGRHYRSFDRLGAHVGEQAGVAGVHFAVWAPNAQHVDVIGEFNGWQAGATPLRVRPEASVWEAFVPGIGAGAPYKYRIVSQLNGYVADRADPYGFGAELRPQTASKVVDLEGFAWTDKAWVEARRQHDPLAAPMSIYEVHLGSWRRSPEDPYRWLSYREVAPLLAQYARDMGYTHVELLPITEHPFDGSWGYQTVGYYAPTSRFGSPHDFMFLVNTLHEAGIGVLLDWVPAHFPHDPHGLGYFDGTHLYEHADPRQGHHPDWDTLVFNYGRTEVKNFLISNALFWLEKYHLDGLRVDAVASMLYLDYGRRDGEWIPNQFGGRENLEAVSFLRELNTVVHGEHPGVVMAAEESTSWPMVSRPTYLGGLGFGVKWNMGWMHDMLDYFSLDPIYRSHHHHRITFSLLYAFTENFLLPFSHDEVVHGKRSMLEKMPGDDWQKFANLRLLYGYQFGHPGKKLQFMGCEFGQRREWNHDIGLDWYLLDQPLHAGLQRWVRDLNHLYRDAAPLYARDFDPAGFEWIDCNDHQRSLVSFMRRGHNPDDVMMFVCNFTPVPRHGEAVGAPLGGFWQEVLNSDATDYGGSGVGNCGGATAVAAEHHGRPFRLDLVVPPLGVVVLRSTGARRS